MTLRPAAIDPQGHLVGAADGSLLAFPGVATTFGQGILHIDSLGVLSAGPIWGSSPPKSGAYDSNFGVPFATTDAAWGTTGFVTVDSTAMRRGDSWVDAGKIRPLSTNDRLMFQVSQDLGLYQIGLRTLTYAADDAVMLQFSFDGCDDSGVGASSLLFVWAQDNGSGNVDTSNCFQIEVDNYDSDTWLITYTYVIAGVGFDVYSLAYINFDCPWLAIAIEGHAGSYRGWAGKSFQNLNRIGADAASPVHPTLFGIFAVNSGRPMRTPYPSNTTWGLGTFRRQANTNA